MSSVTTFLHNGSIGDCWASIPVMKEYYRKFNKKIILYLEKDVKAFYYENATHPTIDKDGTMVMLNQQVIDMMIPLFKAQEFIEDCRVWNGEKIQGDLTQIRTTFVNMPHGDLRMWYPIIFPDLVCNFAVPYITVPEMKENFAKDKLIVARSERYHNPQVSYYFLKQYEDRLLFVGTDLEYAIFTIRYKLKITRLVVDNFLELAQILKQSLGLLSNQTQIFQIAEGLKIPRTLELCSFAPNVIPMGENGSYFYSQFSLMLYIKELLGETEKTQLSGFSETPELNLGVEKSS